MDDPDAALIVASGRGDWKAFESLVKRYQDPLLRFATRYLGDRATAEDVIQEVFLRIYRAAPRFEARARVSSWIFRIAYHVLLTELDRRRRRQDLCSALSQNLPDNDRDLLAAKAQQLELEQEVKAALAALPGSQRAALLLRITEELSYREIGEVLGIGVASVESLLFRARKSMRKHLGRGEREGVQKCNAKTLG